jgi:hypothetical protein
MFALFCVMVDDSNYRVRCAVGPTDGPEKEKEKSKKK